MTSRDRASTTVRRGFLANLFGGSSSSSQSTPPKPEDFVETQEFLLIKKLWQEEEKNQTFREKGKVPFNEIVKNFMSVCVSCEGYAFYALFGEGNSFANSISNALAISLEQTMTSRPLVKKSNTIQGLTRLFLHPNELMNQYIDVLYMLATAKNSFLPVFSVSLPFELIRVLELFLIFTSEEIVQGVSADIQNPVQTLKLILNKLSKLLAVIAKNKTTMEHLKGNDGISSLIRIIGANGSPEENIYVKKIAFSMLAEMIEASGAPFIEFLSQKLRVIQLLLNSVKHADDQHIHTNLLISDTILYLLQKSCTVPSNPLLKDFLSANGYQILMDAILKCEKHFNVQADSEVMQKLVKNSADLVYVGDKPLTPEEKSKVPPVATKGNRIKSIDAFQVFCNSFLKASNPLLQHHIIDNMLAIFADDSLNYPIVHHMHNVVIFIKNIHDFSEEVQATILKLIEFIVAGLNFVPQEELESMTSLLHTSITPGLTTLITNTVFKLLKFDSKYKDYFRQAKLLEAIVHLLKTKFSLILVNRKSEDTEHKVHSQLLNNTVDILITMLENNQANIQQFRESGGIQALQQMLLDEMYRDFALRVFQAIIVQDTFQKQFDVTTLVEFLQTSESSNISLKLAIFNALKKMFYMNERSKDAFREVGFVSTVSVLINTSWPVRQNNAEDQQLPEEKDVLILFESLFRTLTAALLNHPRNKSMFIKLIGRNAIPDALTVNGVLNTPFRKNILQFLLDFATERSLAPESEAGVGFEGFILPPNARLVNPFALMFILDVIPPAETELNLTLLKLIEKLLLSNTFNIEALSKTNIMDYLFKKYDSAFTDAENKYHKVLFSILQIVASYRLSPFEWRTLLKYLQPEEHEEEFLNALVQVARNTDSTPYVLLEPGASCPLLALDDKIWNPTSAYSLSCWVYCSKCETLPLKAQKGVKPAFTLLELATADIKSYLKLQIRPGGYLQMQINLKGGSLAFTKVKFQPNTWHHIVLVHQKFVLQPSVATLYVDGKLEQVEKISFITPPAGTGQKITGFLGKNNSAHDHTWRVGPTLLCKDVIPASAILAMYCAGPSYTGLFQGDYVPTMSLLNDYLTPSYFDVIENEKETDLKQVTTISSMKIPEENIVFSFNARLNKLVDINSNTKEINLQQENLQSLPSNAIFLYNVLTGSNQRPVAMLKGQSECCAPVSLHDMCLSFDGLLVVFALIERAERSEYLQSALQLLSNLLTKSHKIVLEMDRMNGYYILSSLLRQHASIITPQILDLLWNILLLAGQSKRKLVANMKACVRVMLDYETWKRTSISMQKQLFRTIIDLVNKESEFGRWNALRLKNINIIPSLLRILDQSPPLEIVEVIVEAIRAIIDHKVTEEDVNNISDFLLYSLDVESKAVGAVNLSPAGSLKPFNKSSGSGGTLKKTVRKKGSTILVAARNLVLKLILDIIIQPNPAPFIDIFAKVANLNWFYQFITHKIHPTSLVLSMQLLSALMISGHFRNEKIYTVLRQGLIPYCNQHDLYYVLFSLMMGKRADYKNSYDMKNESVVIFNDLIDAQKEPRVEFEQVLPVILSLLKYNTKTSTMPAYEPSSAFEYFMDFVGNSRKKIDLGIKDSETDSPVLNLGSSSPVITFSTSVEENTTFSGAESPIVRPVIASQPTAPTTSAKVSFNEAKSRIKLCMSIIDFLNTLFAVSNDFKLECKKSDTLELLAGILFTNAVHPARMINVTQTQPKQQEDEDNPSATTTQARPEEVQPISPMSSPNLSGENSADSLIFTTTTSKRIFDLLTSIIVSEYNTSYKGKAILDDVLQAVPASAAESTQNTYRTIVVSNLIKYYSSANRLKEIAGNHKLSSNLAQFCQNMVDLHGMEILPFSVHEQSIKFIVDTVQQIEVAEAASQFNLKKILTGGSSALSLINSSNLGIAYRALNRFILFLLTKDLSSELYMTEVLTKLLENNWSTTAFAPANKDQEFLQCLIFILFSFLRKESEVIRENALMYWKLIVASYFESTMFTSLLTFKVNNSETVEFHNGFKKILEKDSNSFLSWFAQESARMASFIEPAHGAALENFLQNEKKATNSLRNSLVKSLANRKSSTVQKEKKGAEFFYSVAKDCKQEITQLRNAHEKKLNARAEQDIIRTNSSLEKWSALKSQLVKNRGLWGLNALGANELEPEKEKWKLDYTEGPFRMRRKLEVDTKPELILSPEKIKKVGSMQSTQPSAAPSTPEKGGAILAQYKQLEELQMSPNKRDTFEGTPSGEAIPGSPSESSESNQMNRESTETADVDEDEFAEDYEEGDDAEAETEFQEDFKIRRLVDIGDTILHRYNCLRIRGLDGQKGLFLICKKSVYIIDNYTITSNNEVVEVNGDHNTSRTWNPDEKGNQQSMGVEHPVIKIPLNNINEVLKRRFLLQVTALELFCLDGRNYLVVFEKSEMEKVHSLVAGHSKITNPQAQLQKMTLAWQRGDVSNFEYLMFLNTMAGRSYNDFTQYPVFPWILSDYTSKTLDLTNPSSFRDLSRPMGALNEKRREMFQQRYEMWEDPVIPKFHYGTHYSSAGMVLYYLIRMQPFTAQSIELQGGKFDIADRLFYSIGDTWISASSDYAMADVKELIPEFFYLPDFLVNDNKLDFGKRQGGTVVSDVMLPPWSNNDPYEFIRIHRKALESDYVSDHLHEWIDLIFGYKQRGKEAEQAVNIFYYLTYEGAVDIDAIQDPVEKQAAISQISNFGQTPQQLFIKPHPKRNTAAIRQRLSTENKMKFFLHPEEATSTQEKTLSDAVGYLASDLNAKSKNVVAALAQAVTNDTKEQLFALPKGCVYVKPKYNKYFSFGHADNNLKLTKLTGVGIVGGLNIAGVEATHVIQQSWENLHAAPITCIQIDDQGRILVIGSQDGAMTVWKITKAKTSSKVQLHLLARLSGHTQKISCIAISNEHSIIVSGSDDSTCIVWDLNQLKFVRELRGNQHGISAVKISPETGEIVMCANTSVFVWSINGKMLTSLDGGRTPITAVAFSGSPSYLDDEQYIFTAHKDGTVKWWKIVYHGSVKDTVKEEAVTSPISNNTWSNVQFAEHFPENVVIEDIEVKSPISPAVMGSGMMAMNMGQAIESVASTSNAASTTISPPTPSLPTALASTSTKSISLEPTPGKTRLVLVCEKQKYFSPITQLCVSKDQRKLYSGDEKGFVVSWTIPLSSSSQSNPQPSSFSPPTNASQQQDLISL